MNAMIRTWMGVVLISFSAVFVRLADVEPARSAFLRNAYALPVLIVLVLYTRRRSGGSAFVPAAVVAGLFLGLDLVAWHVSIAHIGAGLATVLPNLQVVFVGVAGMVVFGERPARWFWAALPVVLLGVWLIATAGQPVIAEGSVPLGVALGVVTALFYSGFLIVLRAARLRSPDAGAVAVLTSATFGAMAATGAFAGTQGVASPAGAWPADGWLIALALGSQVMGWLLLTSSIHRLPAALTSVALLLQPLLALVWGAVLLEEPIGWPQVGGAAVLLAGVAAAHRAVVTGQRREAALAEETLH